MRTMPINQENLMKAALLIGGTHAGVLVRLAEKQDRIEAEWERETKKFHKDVIDKILKSLVNTGKASIPDKMFDLFVMRHYFRIQGVAIDSTIEEVQAIDKRLAKPKTPRTFRELREIYDRYRKTGRLPKGLKDMASKIKDSYLKKTQSVWRKYSEEFREGKEFTQQEVLRKIRKEADVVKSRAQTIVRTETTNYYNTTRKEIYDETDAVTHYLFLAIRDQATTKWCTDKVWKGLRGRHGLVYAKDDPLTKKETPACHWNCRSEMVPLTPFNPRHKKLIADAEKHRRNNKCHPLPEGWR